MRLLCTSVWELSILVDEGLEQQLAVPEFRQEDETLEPKHKITGSVSYMG